MKEETKELIEWMKCQILISQDQSAFITKSAEEKFRTNKETAIQFLETLPEIESHLCFGGYIQDRNGTPCCHGDKVRFKLSHCLTMEKHIKEHREISTGTLEWNSRIRAFIIRFDNATWDGDWVCFDAGNDEIEWFEKMEE